MVAVEVLTNPVVIIVLGFTAGLGSLAVYDFYKWVIKNYVRGEK